MGQTKYRHDTSRTAVVSFQASERHEQIAWLKDFAVGLAVAIGAGTVFALTMSLCHAVWTALS